MDWDVLAGNTTCSREELHTDPDKGMPYLVWNERMMKTHRPRQCPGCGLFKVWEPKE